MNFTVSTKILLGYLAVLTITALTVIALVTTTQGVKNRADEFIETTLPELSALQTLNGLISLQEISAFSLYGTTINSQQFDQQRSDYQQQIQQTLQIGISQNRLNDQLDTYQKDLDNLRAVMTSQPIDWDLARDRLASLSEHAADVREQLSSISVDVSNTASHSSEMILEDMSGTLRLLVAMIVGISAVAAMGFWLSRQQIAKPIQALAQHLEYVAKEHDLRNNLAQTSNDEVGQATASSNQLLQEFHKSISDVMGAIDAIGTSVSSLSSATSIADGTVDRLKSEIDRLVGVAQQLAEQMSASVDDSQHAANTANQGAQEVEDGVHQVESTAHSISRLASNIESSANSLLELRNAGDKVSSVVGTIAEISDQTNLLALNAAIEAARAGESGRGFAVVADEVRTLASRTRQSTVQINDMMDSIVASITSSVDSMEANQKNARDSVEQAQSTVTSLQAIKQTIIALRDQSTKVASDNSRVQQDVVMISENINHFKVMGDEVSTGSQETREAAGTLQQLSSSLSQLVARFKV
ncbi:MAG: methyl-accepting chemotaxis protein [Cellvibrionaceae bacterium]